MIIVSNAMYPQGSNMFPATHVYRADIQVCQILYGQHYSDLMVKLGLC